MTELLAAIGFACLFITAPICVSPERIEACDLTCVEHGGLEFVLADAAAFNCLCADWTLAVIGDGNRGSQ